MITPPVPSKIGKYDVLGVIGRGGMGVVYQARDPHLDRRVAIKMITGAFSENSDMLKRFFREAQSLGSLQHPNIVTVFDLGDFEGHPYFVMEFLEGEGLDSVLSAGRSLNLMEKISIVIQVCQGLGYAHRRGVVHRDIKPANIMISKDGGVKIFDFGIAHAGQANVTRTGEILGTLRYMAPEQVNSKAVDSRTDIFATGVVLYQLITDHLPFDGENTAATLMKIVGEAPPPLGSFLASYPPEMEQILLRALAKNPDDRYGTAEDFAMDLAELQGQLKEELIGREMEEVAHFIVDGEVLKARGTLLRVLKIDHHHTGANRLMREVQQRIQRDERSKLIRGLREQAEQALADDQFDRALEHVDSALGLDRDRAELQQLRGSICAAAARAEKVHKALKAADVAQAEGDLESAMAAAQEALAVAPNDTRARMSYRVISQEMDERARQRQMEGCAAEERLRTDQIKRLRVDRLQNAKQSLYDQNFDAAIQALEAALRESGYDEDVRALLARARREQSEAVQNTVLRAEQEILLDERVRILEEALRKNPQDVRVKELLHQARNLNQVISQIAAAAQKLEEERRYDLALAKWETVSAVYPHYPGLKDIIKRVHDLKEQAHTNDRQDWINRIEHALNSRDYEQALSLIERANEQFPWDTDLTALQVRAEAGARHLVRMDPGASGSQELRNLVENRKREEMGSPDPVGTTRTPMPDGTISARTDAPTRSFDGGNTRSQAGLGNDALTEASLQLVERNLATFLGPLARIVVKRAAAKTASVAELYTLLASESGAGRRSTGIPGEENGPGPAQGSFAIYQVAAGSHRTGNRACRCFNSG